MEAVLKKFNGKVDAKSLIKTVEDLKVTYVDDGLTRSDIPPIVSRLMQEASKCKNLSGSEKKKLVIGVLFHFIEQIDQGEEDSEFESILKTMVPPMIDGFAALLKVKNSLLCCLKK